MTLPVKRRLASWFTESKGYAAGSLCGATGILLLVGLAKINLDGTLTLGNIVQSACTVFAAIYVSRVINHWASNRQKEKDLIHRRLDAVDEVLADLDSLELTLPLQSVTLLLKRLSMHCGAISQVRDASSIVGTHECSLEMQKHVQTLRNLLTYTPVDAGGLNDEAIGDAVNVIGGQLHIGEDRKRRISIAVANFRTWIWVAQIRIARE
ncbi:hypothetical protein [Gimesia maris]|uniref:hypothetical protein n=1 Tax=Gimesia maris TaxID=122 RepID=UPI003A8EAF40